MGYWEQVAVDNLRHAERRARMSRARRIAGDLASGVGWGLLGVVAFSPLWAALVMLMLWLTG